ncbi:hypothetical protein [Ferrimonas pelagia]|uniref:Uncharacterized protein n=1 Tax=Ferrimonas pelagia TaxID=1177826 RepID=A0ABP9E868_9GAMM
MSWRITLLFLAYLLLGAHFLRYDAQLIALALVAAPLLLLSRHVVAVRLLQAGLLLGVAAAWLPTAWQLVAFRQLAGEPYLRLGAIMAGVMLFSLLAAWAIHPLFQDKYRKM